MKIPHDKYIKTLVAGKLTQQDIKRDLEKLSLFSPPAKDVDIIRNSLKLGQEDYFAGKESVDLNWLKDLGIEAMYGYKFGKQVIESTRNIPGAIKVLDDRVMYRIITSLAMAGVTSDDIELIVNAKYDIEYSSEQLDTFLKYFFDVTDWSYYEKDIYANAVRDDQLSIYYRMALEEDKDVLMWKLGLMPNRSFDGLLRDMFVDSVYNFKEQSTRNQDQAYKWGTLALKVQERLDKVERDLNEESDTKQDIEMIFNNMQAEQKTKEIAEEAPDPFKSFQPLTHKEIPKIVKPEDLN